MVPHGNHVGFIDWLLKLDVSDGESLSKLSKALLICWQFWKDKNHVILRNGKSTSNGVHSLVSYYLKIRWKPTRADHLKINFDGAIINSKTTTGFVIGGFF